VTCAERFRIISTKNNAVNTQEGILTTDRVHLNAAGNRFVAEVMLKSLGE